ncbi:MAG TPA: DUF6632 domain-containing protein [Terracidiphilus sp.]|nr:DUF6632 domain-containing protein [Terracidiphilus sp.]
MKFERTRQIVLAIVGLLYLALFYFLYADLWHSSWLVAKNYNEIEPMFLSFFIALGVFLLLAARKPSAYRSLIAFAAWQSIAHSFVMLIETLEAFAHGIHRNFLDVVITAVIGVVLLALVPAKQEAATRVAV